MDVESDFNDLTSEVYFVAWRKRRLRGNVTVVLKPQGDCSFNGATLWEKCALPPLSSLFLLHSL